VAIATHLSPGSPFWGGVYLAVSKHAEALFKFDIEPSSRKRTVDNFERCRETTAPLPKRFCIFVEGTIDTYRLRFKFDKTTPLYERFSNFQLEKPWYHRLSHPLHFKLKLKLSYWLVLSHWLCNMTVSTPSIHRSSNPRQLQHVHAIRVFDGSP
jgi:hypothetical protein